MTTTTTTTTMTNTNTNQPSSFAAQAVHERIADLHSLGTVPHPCKVAAAAIWVAADRLIPGNTESNQFLRLAFNTLAAEVRGGFISDAIREALAEQFPALQPAPRPGPAEQAPEQAPEPVAWCRSDEFENAMKPNGGSFNGWKNPGQGRDRCDMALYASPPPRGQSITPTPASERPWERPGWCDAEGCCWYHNGPSVVGRSIWIRLQITQTMSKMLNADDGWLLPASAIRVPAEEGQP